jgi:hypothetical protein
MELEASLVTEDDPHAVRVRATVTNTGAADIPIDTAVVRLTAFRTGDLTVRGRPNWARILSSGIFEDHERIESQETISDEVLMPLIRADASSVNETVALRLTCLVVSKPKRQGSSGIGWTRNIVLPVKLSLVVPIESEERSSTVTDKKTGRSSTKRLRRVSGKETREIRRETEERQREVTDEEARKIKKETKDK